MAMERDWSYFLSISFNQTELKNRTHPINIPTGFEISTTIIQYLWVNKPDVIEYKVEAKKSLTVVVLWTPLYLSDVRLGEPFWGRGKGYVIHQH